MTRLEEQVLALAGVVQAARLVDQISRTGTSPEEFLTPTINSLFAFDPKDTADVYGGVEGVKLGLHNLAAMLANKEAPDGPDMVRYAFGILHLERSFARSGDMVDLVV